MVNEVKNLLGITYANKRVRALSRVCDYYNDGLYKKVKSKIVELNHHEALKTNSKDNSKLEVVQKKVRVFPRDLLNKNFKLLDIEKQKVVNLNINNNKKEDYKMGIINTSSPLVCCLINKKVNDVILVRSFDNRINLISQYKILEIN